MGAVEDKNTIDKVWPSAREVKPAAGSAVQVIKQKESLSRSETPELTQEIDRHSKWKVLNAYSALKNEDFEASFVQKEREKMKVQEKETKGRYLDQHKTRQWQAQLKRDRAA